MAAVALSSDMAICLPWLDDAYAPEVERGIHPEAVVLVAPEQVGRQDALALGGCDAAAHVVQTGRAQPRVELRLGVLHVVEIVLEGVLAHEIVDRVDRLPRLA